VRERERARAGGQEGGRDGARGAHWAIRRTRTLGG
jgi:hypothetical protein